MNPESWISFKMQARRSFFVPMPSELTRMKKNICYLLLIAFLFVPISTAHSINVKTQGKLALAVLLSGVAILTKYLVNRDQRAIEDLHAKLGPPDRVIEFERGFDHWRIEWYGHRQYIFRNQVLQKKK